MKKALIVGTLFLALVAFAFAGGSKEKTASSSNAGNGGVSGKMSLLSWYAQKEFAPVLDGFKKEYPNVSIDFQNVPSANSQYAQRLNLLANSGELPDVFYIQPPLTLMAKNGYLADISGLKAVKRLPATYQNFYSYDGKVYAFSPDAWVGGVFYNKALFAKYGIKEFNNWNDFLLASHVFMNHGIKPISMGSDELADLVYWLHMVDVLTKNPNFDQELNTGKVKFSQGYLGPITTWYNDVVKTGIVTKQMVALSDQQRMDEFASGKAAMTISGPWAISTFMQKNPKLQLGIMPFVGPDGQKYAIGALNVGIAISSKSGNRSAAQAFINYMGSNSGLKKYQGVTGDFLGVSGVDYSVNPVMQPMKKFAASGHFSYPPVDWTFTGTIVPMMTKGLQEIVLGTTTPKKLMRDIDAQIATQIQQ